MGKGIEFKTEDGVILRGWHYVHQGFTEQADQLLAIDGIHLPSRRREQKTDNGGGPGGVWQLGKGIVVERALVLDIGGYSGARCWVNHSTAAIPH